MSFRAPAPLAAVLTVAFLAAAPLIASPLGDFAPPLALLLVLPPIAVGLSALGWGRWLGDQLRARVPGRERPGALFLLWSAISALLSLDVAAVAAADVGMEVAADDATERDLQLRSAVLGSNLGSLLFPFSNLTNLLLVAATGISFSAYTWRRRSRPSSWSSSSVSGCCYWPGAGTWVTWWGPCPCLGRQGRIGTRSRSRWGRPRMSRAGRRPWPARRRVRSRRSARRRGSRARRPSRRPWVRWPWAWPAVRSAWCSQRPPR